MPADFYKELGIDKGASAEEVKKAYRKLAAQLHPDKNPGNAAAEARFKAVNHAYQVLSDKKKRALYDEFGEAGLREGFQPEAARAYQRRPGRVVMEGDGTGFNFEDIFSSPGRGGLGDLMGDLFGGRAGGRRRNAPIQGADVEGELTVDFADAIAGTTVSVTMGNAEGVKVRIPPGAGDGDRVRVPGQGEPGANHGKPGDLIITVRVRPHPFFEREGLDLHLDLPITAAEAYRGAKVSVPTPEGHVTLKVPAHAQSGQVVRLKGRGVRRKNETGDLFVRFLIQLPDQESKELESAIDTLEKATTGDVRAGIKL